MSPSLFAEKDFTPLPQASVFITGVLLGMFVRKKGEGITQLKYLKTFNRSGSLTTVCSLCDFLRAADASWKKL